MTSTIPDSPSTSIPDLSDPRTFVEGVPHAAFAALRERPGLFWQPTDVGTANGGFWAVTRWADIVEIEKDPATFTSSRGVGYPTTNLPAVGPMMDNIIFNDPPGHSRLRRGAAKGFGPRVIANFEGWIREIVREAIATVADRNEFDFVEEFARTIPAYVVARALGMPAEDRELLVTWANAIFAAQADTSGEGEGETGQDKIHGVLEAVHAYSSKIQQIKQDDPADDMFTLVGALVQSGDLTQSEFLQWMYAMMVAGFETTHTAIGLSLRMYLEDPEVRDRVDRAVDEGLAPRVADEFLRLISPPMHMARTATVDTVVAGQDIRADDLLVLYFVAANRDTAVFDDPDRFDPWRKETATLAFGSGIHRCIGQHLAKLEISILWEELRASGIDFRLNGEPKRGWSVFINQLTALPVAKG